MLAVQGIINYWCIDWNILKMVSSNLIPKIYLMLKKNGQLPSLPSLLPPKTLFCFFLKVIWCILMLYRYRVYFKGFQLSLESSVWNIRQKRLFEFQYTVEPSFSWAFVTLWIFCVECSVTTSCVYYVIICHSSMDCSVSMRKVKEG